MNGELAVGEPAPAVTLQPLGQTGHLQRVHWLLGELAILLEFSEVGLYEFMWILQTDFPGCGAHEYRADATAALGHLLERGASLLRRRKGSTGTVAAQAIPLPADEDWDDPQFGTVYLAVAGPIALTET